MRNVILATAAALALMAGTAVASTNQGASTGNSNSSSVEDQCANILAKGGATAAEREFCQSRY